jgi:hypothetical protein
MSITAGTYRAVTVKGSEQFGQAKNGSEQFACDVELLDIGETATVILSFSGGARQYSLDKMKAMGIAVGSGDEVTHSGAEFSVSVSYENFDGKDRMRVDVLTSRVKLRELDAGQKRALFADLRRELSGR